MAKFSQESLYQIIFLLNILTFVVSIDSTEGLTYKGTTPKPTEIPHSQESTTFNELSKLSTEWDNSQKTFALNQTETAALFNNCTHKYEDSCIEFNKTPLKQGTNDTDHWTSTPAPINLTNDTSEAKSTLESTQNTAGNLDFSRLLRIVAFVAIFVGFVVVKINVLVMIAFVRNRELRQNNHYNLVMGLSFSDFLMGLSALITGFRLLFPILTSLLTLCIIMNVFCVASLLLSTYQIFCISLNRYLVLSENQWANKLFDGNRKYFICIFGWIVVFVIFSSFISPEGDTKICLYASVFGKFRHASRWTFCFLFLLFLSLTVCFYFLAILEVKKRYMNVSSIASSQIDLKKKTRVLRSMKLVGTILLALFVFSSPLIFSTLYGQLPPLHLGAFAAANINSFLNPFIYCSRIKNLRNEIKSVLCCSSVKK